MADSMKQRTPVFLVEKSMAVGSIDVSRHLENLVKLVSKQDLKGMNVEVA